MPERTAGIFQPWNSGKQDKTCRAGISGIYRTDYGTEWAETGIFGIGWGNEER